jgi:hypothetical protein
MFGYGSIDDLFAARSKNIDLDEGISRFETCGQRFRIVDPHGAPEYNFTFFLRSANQFVFRLRPGKTNEEKNQKQNKSTITGCFHDRWIPHGFLSNSPLFVLCLIQDEMRLITPTLKENPNSLIV